MLDFVHWQYIRERVSVIFLNRDSANFKFIFLSVKFDIIILPPTPKLWLFFRTADFFCESVILAALCRHTLGYPFREVLAFFLPHFG